MNTSYRDLLSWAKECSEFSLVWRDEVAYNQVAFNLEKSLLPFLMKKERVNKWPGTEIMGNNAIIRIYRVCDESIQVLRSVKDIFFFVGPDYPEDLAFYIDGKVVFASVAHEEMAWFEE